MSYNISSITPADIPDVQKLFQQIYADRSHLIKGMDELEWLFSDPSKKNGLPGYIARTPRHELVGVIGYSLNQYKFGDREFTGVIPISWMVSPAHRGLLGILLLKQVMKKGDFGFAIQGSQTAQNCYRAVKLKYTGAAHTYTKVLRPLDYIRSGNGLSPGRILKAFYFLGRSNGIPGKTEISLKADSGSQGIHHAPVDHLAMVPEARRNQWLEACPLVSMLSFTLYHRDQEKGPAICYISLNKGIRRGRIVHIPYMGDDMESYRQAIVLLENELVARGCCSVNGLAMLSSSRKAFLRQGYRTHKNYKRPLFVRDPEKLLEGVDLEQWYLTYYESDKGYRGI